MPTYEYACRDCGEHLEVVQSFHDDALTECPNCAGTLRKVFSAAGIIFKGSGWYSKDYAASRPDSSGNGDSGSKTDSSSTDAGTAGSGGSSSDSSSSSKSTSSSTSSTSSTSSGSSDD